MNINKKAGTHDSSGRERNGNGRTGFATMDTAKEVGGDFYDNFSTSTVTFANAGHNAPLVRRKNGIFEYFKSRPGFVLGGMEGICCKRGELALNPGDDRLHHILNTLGQHRQTRYTPNTQKGRKTPC